MRMRKSDLVMLEVTGEAECIMSITVCTTQLTARYACSKHCSANHKTLAMQERDVQHSELLASLKAIPRYVCVCSIVYIKVTPKSR